MTILLYVTSLAVFLWFFYAIGARYIGLIPLIFGLVIVIISSKDYRTLSWESLDRQRYSIYVWWIAMLIWFIGIATFFSDNTVQIWLWIMGINIIFWLASQVFSYKDGTYMAQTWYYMTILYILWQASYVLDWYGLWNVVSMLWVLTLGIVWFIVGVIWHRRQVASYLWYKVFILSGWTILIAVQYYVQDIYTALLIDSILVLLLSFVLYRILHYHIPTTEEIKTVSVRRILAWERITKNNHIPKNNKLISLLYHFVRNMPLWTRYSIEWINCGLVVITIILYLSGITTSASQRHQLVYWLIIWLFITTALFLKRIWFTSVMQKVTLFAVINYAIYLTLYTVFDTAIGSIAGWAIVWNIMSSVMIFYGPTSFLSDILHKADYRYWIVMTVLALCFNVYLLWLTSLPGQLVFSIVFVYLWLQGILLYYGIRHIQQIE